MIRNKTPQISLRKDYCKDCGRTIWRVSKTYKKQCYECQREEWNENSKKRKKIKSMNKEFTCKLCGYTSNEATDFIRQVHINIYSQDMICNDCSEHLDKEIKESIAKQEIKKLKQKHSGDKNGK